MADTLERIAELAGVSRSTVSRVLNQDPHVRDSTRARVLEIVERERFEPNRAARGLASGRAGMIGVVISVDLAHLFSDPYFPLVLKGIYDAARSRDLVVSLWIVDAEDDPRAVNKIARGSMLDGAIVAAGATNDPTVAALCSTSKPFVLLGRPADDPSLSYVDVDNRDAAAAATTHLLARGRRRIATVAGPSFSIAAIDRKAGYLDALVRAGIEPDPDLVYESDFSAASAVVGTRRLIDHEPDAIVAANDVMAVAIMAELAAMGRRVPDDVAVVGFDDLPIAAQANPSLTTVRQPIGLLAREALGALTELIADPSSGPRQIVIPTELIIRSSCGSATR